MQGRTLLQVYPRPKLTAGAHREQSLQEGVDGHVGAQKTKVLMECVWMSVTGTWEGRIHLVQK